MIFKKYGKPLMDAQDSLEPEMATSHPFSASPLPEEDFPEPFEETADLFIAEGVSVKGEIQCMNLLRLDGYFEGTIENGKKIIVGPKGHLKANLKLDEAFIAGKIEGDLCVQKRLVLRGRAEVYGNITAPALSVDEGVAIVGQLLVSSSNQ